METEIVWKINLIVNFLVNHAVYGLDPRSKDTPRTCQEFFKIIFKANRFINAAAILSEPRNQDRHYIDRWTSLFHHWNSHYENIFFIKTA